MRNCKLYKSIPLRYGFFFRSVIKMSELIKRTGSGVLFFLKAQNSPVLEILKLAKAFNIDYVSKSYNQVVADIAIKAENLLTGRKTVLTEPLSSGISFVQIEGDDSGLGSTTFFDSEDDKVPIKVAGEHDESFASLLQDANSTNYTVDDDDFLDEQTIDNLAEDINLEDFSISSDAQPLTSTPMSAASRSFQPSTSFKRSSPIKQNRVTFSTTINTS